MCIRDRSNLSFDHLRVIVEDPDCMRGVCAILQDMVDNHVEPAAAACLTACASVPIGKPHSDGVRPLAVPETLYKLAGLLALESIKHVLPQLFPSIQYGCGVKGGPEIAVHCTQLALERGGPGTVVLRTDFKNAFNDRNRHVIARALFACKSTSPLWRFFVFAYGGASHLGVYERGHLVHRFLADNGVKQGCPIASFLYALSVQSLYEACIAEHRDVEAYAVADDFTLTGQCLSVLDSVRNLITLTEHDGPNLNLNKCSVLWPYSREHPDFQEFADGMGELGIRICYDSIDMLGTTIGLGMTREAHCITVATSHDHLLSALVHPDMPAQLAALLVRQNYMTRLGYLARVTPPVVFRRAAEIFDERTLAAATTITGLPMPTADNSTQQMLCLPFRLDGLGFTPLTTISPCAWWASLANAARTVRGELTAAGVVAHVDATDTAFHLRDTYSVLHENGIDPNKAQHKHAMPSSIDDYWRFYSGAKQDIKPHLQGHLAHAITDAYFVRTPLLPLTNASDHGNDPSNQPTAHLHLTAVPTAYYNNLSTRAFRASILHRYNLPCRPGLPAKCVCGEDMTPTHFHSCKRLKRTGATRRHDSIIQLLLSFCRQAGMVARAEPVVRDASGHRTRPDFMMLTHAGTVYVDVSICCPTRAATLAATRAQRASGARPASTARPAWRRARSSSLSLPRPWATWAARPAASSISSSPSTTSTTSSPTARSAPSSPPPSASRSRPATRRSSRPRSTSFPTSPTNLLSTPRSHTLLPCLSSPTPRCDAIPPPLPSSPASGPLPLLPSPNSPPLLM